MGKCKLSHAGRLLSKHSNRQCLSKTQQQQSMARTGAAAPAPSVECDLAQLTAKTTQLNPVMMPSDPITTAEGHLHEKVSQRHWM
jgi:hypothetical protein